MSHSTKSGTLSRLAKTEAACKRCPLYEDATQVVPGEGLPGAHFMLVGEQPEDKENLAGKPFVGPAGRILDAALKDAGIDRKDAFVTNAVKHFKHEMRGKRRLHKRPNNYEIERCRTWLSQEREAIGPAVVIALGVTAARGLTAKTITISKARKSPTQLEDGAIFVVTIHPSALLRIEDASEKSAAYENFVADLKAARLNLRRVQSHDHRSASRSR